MSRKVVISGLGPVSALGVGVEPTWEGAKEGRSAVAPVEAFDAGGFDARIAGEVRNFKVNRFVPKSYRKATKVMARDIALAVGAADQAARDAGLRTRGTDPEASRDEAYRGDYDPDRVGTHVGAGLIAADLDELSAALYAARDEQGRFDLHRWGEEGMENLTPLWLLKYLPNMLACHLTIIHDAQGPSNTITCAEASAALSLGESLRVIQRDNADLCFCGGAESKLNLMAFYRQHLTGRLNPADNEHPAEAVRPFDETAAGTVAAEGGGVLTIEAEEAFRARKTAAAPYARVTGFGASQSNNTAHRNELPEEDGRILAGALERALEESGASADTIDFVVANGIGLRSTDAAEAAALQRVFGDRLAALPVLSFKPLLGNCLAGAGGVDLCLAAKMLSEQTLPPVVNRPQPMTGLGAGPTSAEQRPLRRGLLYSAGFGGQNAALILESVGD